MKFLTNVKTWILTIVFFIGIGVAFASWLKLPVRIEKVEEKADKTEDNVQQLANSLDKYIAVQETRWDNEREQKKLLIELLKKEHEE